MKFGRLAKTYKENGGRLDNLHGIRGIARRQLLANLDEIISRDRNFEQIGGLQNMKDEEAKKFFRMYEGNPEDIDLVYMYR